MSVIKALMRPSTDPSVSPAVGSQSQSSASKVPISAVIRTSLPQAESRIPPSNAERRFNLIVQGLDECPQGTKKFERTAEDLRKVSQVFTSLDSSITSDSVRDFFRLGRFNPDHERPRPVLVKMIRATDVSLLL